MKTTLAAALLCLSTSAFASPKVIKYFTPRLSVDQATPARVSIVKTSKGHDIFVTMPKTSGISVDAEVSLNFGPKQATVDLSKPMVTKLGYDTARIHVPSAIMKVNGPATVNVSYRGYNGYGATNVVAGHKL